MQPKGAHQSVFSIGPIKSAGMACRAGPAIAGLLRHGLMPIVVVGLVQRDAISDKDVLVYATSVFASYWSACLAPSLLDNEGGRQRCTSDAQRFSG